jgi:uncharacterized protein
MAPSNSKETVASFYEAFGQRDFARMRGLLDPQVEFRAAQNFIYAERNPYNGPDAIIALMNRLVEEWDDFRVVPEEINAAGDMAIACGRYTGTFKATGIVLNAEFVHVFKFRDCKIILQHNYTDTLQFRDAIHRAQAGAGS